MQTEQSREAYNIWHDQRGRAESRNPLTFAWYRSVWNEISGMKPKRILEVGCGRGDFALFLAGQIPSAVITAVDFSDVAVEQATEKAALLGRNVSFRCADAEALPFDSGSFDLVISCECMEHVAKPRLMAAELSRVTQSAGKVCLTTENYLNGILLARLHAWLSGRPFDSGSGFQPRENIIFFWQVIRWLREAGLTVERTESSHYQWLLLPGVNPANLATESFSSDWARRMAKPFGRHYSFFARKSV